MKLVPTCALMLDDDPELALACRKLECRLADMEAALREDNEVTEEDDVPWIKGDWSYFGSAPYRIKGVISYVHGFHHRSLWARDGQTPLTIAIPATAGWWPDRCRNLAPRRGPSRGSLRLVS